MNIYIINTLIVFALFVMILIGYTQSSPTKNAGKGYVTIVNKGASGIWTFHRVKI